MSANRQYKDSVFTLLFGTADKILELYNAVSGSNLPSDTRVEIATLTDALFMDRINDLAFVIEDRLVVLIEHQSTICENMPLRLLLYIARIYERFIDGKAIYKSKLISLPRPEFYVLYNGVAPMPDMATLRLSDAFVDCPEAKTEVGGFFPLELEVPVINVNVGRNQSVIGKSENLSGYVCFVDKVREYERMGLNISDAIEAAIKYCISSGILVDFLDKNSREVRGMLFTEFNLDDAKDVWFEEGKEDGREEGRVEGLEKGITIGVARGEDRAKRQLLNNLLSMGMPLDQISIATGLCLTQIERMYKSETE